MSTVYSGNGTLISPTTGAGVRKAISAVANTTPIAITCTGHGYNTGDTIEQEGTSGIADGQYQITKTSANAYTLNNTTAGGTASTGYSIDYELLPATTIPANGDLVDMGPLGAALEGSINPQSFLYRRQGKFRLYNQYPIVGGNFISTPFYSNPWSTNTNFTSTSVVALASSTLTLESLSDTTSIPPVFASGDLFEISMNFTAVTLTHTGTQNALIEIGFGLVQNGSLLSTAGLPNAFVNANYLTGGYVATPVALSGWYALASSPVTLPTNALSLCIFARIDYISSSNQVDLNLIGTWSGVCKQWRPN